MSLTLIAPGPLTATADPRVKRGLLLPYTEPGLTNKGKVTASRGALTLAEKARHLTLEHSDKLGVATFEEFEELEDGLYCSVRYLSSPLGDAALAEYESGTRAGLSVEVDEPVIRGGRLVAGVVGGGSQVETPAFPSARLAASEMEDAPDEGEALTASVLDDDPDEDDEATPDVVINGEELPDVESVGVTPERISITTKTPEPDPGPDNQGEGNMTAARVQNAALVAAKTDEPDTGKETLFATLAGVHGKGLSSTKMEAALSDIVPGDILGIEQPQYVGQMWQGVAYERKYIPVFDHADLTSFEIKGWDWADGKKPQVGLYTGNKADIPSNDVETVATSGVIQRIAGGHDIDRKFRDFSNVEFWEKYFGAMTESYAKVSDQYIRDQVKAIPTAGNGQRVHLLTGNAPAGVPTALWQIVRGSIKMIDDLDTLPTFAFVTSDYWEPLFYTKVNDVLAYLDASLGLKEGTLGGSGFRIVPVPVGSLTNGAWVGKTLVGHKSAVKVYELPGSPIRVEAEAISKGGIDEALFGYAGYQVENVKGVISFDAPAAS